MELTSNPDILRVAADGSKFFVNGREMTFKVYDDCEGRVYLEAEVDDYRDTLYQLSWYKFVNLRYPAKTSNIHLAICSNAKDGDALMSVEEMIALIKSGEFEIS